MFKWSLLIFILSFRICNAEVINFNKENFVAEQNLRKSIISDACEGNNSCIDSFRNGEFGINEIGITKYDLNDDGLKDDAIICFESNYFCGARGICSNIVTKNNSSDKFHGYCTMHIMNTKHFGYRDIKFLCNPDSNSKTSFAIMNFDGNKYKFIKFCKKTFFLTN
jgi:hypothetical protein